MTVLGGSPSESTAGPSVETTLVEILDTLKWIALRLPDHSVEAADRRETIRLLNEIAARQAQIEDGLGTALAAVVERLNSIRSGLFDVASIGRQAIPPEWRPPPF